MNNSSPSHSAFSVSTAQRPAERPQSDGGNAAAASAREGYAGDVSPQLAWQWVQSGTALIVDVRSDAEREWVGFVPGALPLAWKQWPGMQLNPAFEQGLSNIDRGNEIKLLMLCRSGVRSIAAARRATELGFHAYNIVEGFEGDADSNGQRGHKGGWRFHGLPWRQS